MHSSVRARDSRRPGKSSSKTAWLEPARVRTVPGGTGRPQAQCGGRLPPPAAGRVGQHQLLGPPGQRRSQACRAGSAGQIPSGFGRRQALRGQQRRDIPGLPGLPGLMGLVASQSAPSEALHLVGLFQEDLEEWRPGSAGWGEPLRVQPWPSYWNQLPAPSCLAYLAQNDPHRGVCLDGEAQCFQGAKGRVHLTFCHTLVEGA